MDTGTQLAPTLVRRLAWEEAGLVEGTEAFVWPATEGADPADEPPSSDLAVRAVLSWASPQVIRFETHDPEPLAPLLLVSTLAVAGPARFVVRKTYQVGTTAACEPAAFMYIVERRDLFRVPVAAKVIVSSANRRWDLWSMDCSLGGLRLCPPGKLDVGSEVEVTVELHHGTQVTLPAVVRHCRPYEVSAARLAAQRASGTKPPANNGDDCDGCPSIVGLQFVKVPGEVERRLSDFVGRHQRRLMPRVNARLPMEYRPPDRPGYFEALAREVSPGDIVFDARKPHLPGERISVRVRVRRHDFELDGWVVACHSGENEVGGHSHVVKLSFEERPEAAEAQFRKMVRELALEKPGSR